MGKKISVIIPVYNVCEYLERCVDSVVMQPYEFLEVIIIDDGSSDGSEVMVDKYAKEDKRIKVIHQKNQGLSAARNAGLSVASGDYLLFVDGDDWIEKYAVNALISIIKHGCDADIIEFGYRMTNGDKDFARIQFDECKLTGPKEILDEFFYGNKITDIVPNKLYRRSLFLDFRFDEGKIHEDYRIMPKLLSRCKKMLIISDVLYCYYRRNNSITNSRFSKKNLERIEASRYVIDYCRKDDYILNSYVNAARIRLCFACIYLYGKLKFDGMNEHYKKVIVGTFENEYQLVRRTLDFRRLPYHKRCFLVIFNHNKSLALTIYRLMRKGVQ